MKFGTALLLAPATVVGLSAHGGIVFDADFEGSTPVDGTSGLVANATVSNLNAGTSVGSWVFSGAGGSEPGAIIANGGLTNNAFAFDQGVSGAGNNRATGLLTETVDLAAGDSMSMEFEIYAARQGAGRQVRLALTDSDGTSTGNRAYVLIFDESNTKSVRGLNTSNGQPVLATNSSGVNTGFTNPGVDNYLSWTSGTMIKVKLDILAGTTASDTGDGPPETGALVSVDWTGDGDFDDTGEVTSVAFGPRDGGVTEIDRFEFFYSGGGTRGGWIDNIVVDRTPVPEPGSLALLAIGAGLMVRRRRG